MFAINNCVSQSTKKTPYEMVFGQPPTIDHNFWIELNKQSNNKSLVDEEDLPHSITNCLDLTDNSVRMICLCLLDV